jgi:glycosyltransferase involved in cell wall biosynthesis
MDLVFVLEYRFDRTPDGKVWTQTGFAYPFWEYYLEVFDAVRIVARVRDVREVAREWKRVDGDRVSIVAVPYYIGPVQFLGVATAVTHAVRGSVTPADAVLLRAPTHLGNLLNPFLARTQHPYGVEVVGDPHVVFASGVTRHPLRPLFRWWATRELKWQCAHACGVSYVTQHRLPHRYPSARTTTFVTHYTDGVLTDADFVASPPGCDTASEGHIRLITVGSLAQPYKGIDVLIDAVAACVRSGHDLTLTVVGDGRYRAELEAQATQPCIQDRVRFLGVLAAGTAVRAELDAAHLFVLASRTEGLPKAMIEAMARGLPCVGTTVGGIPELLPPEDMVPPGDVTALAEKIGEIIVSPSRMQAMSERNLNKSREYHVDIIRTRRHHFYTHIRRVTEEWLAEQSS